METVLDWTRAPERHQAQALRSEAESDSFRKMTRHAGSEDSDSVFADCQERWVWSWAARAFDEAHCHILVFRQLRG